MAGQVTHLPGPMANQTQQGVIEMQVSRTAGYATVEMCRPATRNRRPANVWDRPRNPRWAILRPARPARPNARRAAIAESLT